MINFLKMINLVTLINKSYLKFLFIVLIIATFGCSSDKDETPNEINEEVIDDTIDDEIDTSNFEKIYVEGAEIVFPYYSIKNYLNHDFSTMYYFQELFNETHGGSYVLEYLDQGGQGMDSYPNIIIGGTKVGGTYYTSDETVIGMPVKLSEIPETLNFDFKTSQVDALDSDDKWMASINFIFDNYGTEDSEPINADRDYDLVVMHQYHNFDDSIEDNPLTANTNTTHWYFARNANGSLNPYILTLDGISYTYAVRYKFFINSGDKDNKTHIKFIPYGNSGLPPVLKINVKEVIQISRDYLSYANLTQDLRDLAESNIALPNVWLKSINAGYEVYTGESLLKIDKFKMNL